MRRLHETQPPHAIVIGLDSITGLQTARILAGHGIPVIAIAKDPAHFGCRTRVCEAIVHADTSTDQFVGVLEGMGPRLKSKAVLFPCTDMSVLQISRSRQRLAPLYHVMLPSPEVVETLVDKARFCRLAGISGLPIPRTFLLHDREDARRAADALPFPVVLKPALKTALWKANAKAKAYRVHAPKEFFDLYDRCSKWAELLIVQEWVEGTDSDLYSCNCYFNAKAEPVATFVSGKLRQWPPNTGTGCLSKECRNDTVLQETIRLFRSVGYRGLGYLEMKRDRRTGKHLIIEANIGRPTGRSAMAEAAGVDLLHAMYCDALGWPLPLNLKQNYQGVKWVYWRHDLQSAVCQWLSGRLSLLDWWRSYRGRKTHAVYSRTDPAPFLYDLSATVRRVYARISPKIGRKADKARTQHSQETVIRPAKP